MSENTKPNNERPADLAVQDSVGGMARRLLNPAHLRELAGRGVKTLREQGAEQLWRDIKFRVGLAMHHDDWRHRADIPLRRELKAQRAAHLQGPKISIIVPLYNTPAKLFDEMLQSVVRQTYANWELVLVDASDADKRLERRLPKAVPGTIVYEPIENGGIALNTTHGFALAHGEYITLLDHDDVLYPNALFEVVQTIQNTGADFVYSDEIVLSADLKELGGYHFKPDFAPDYLRGVNFITHLAVFSRPLLDAAGAYESKEFDGAQDHDLILRLTEKAQRIEHIKKVLYIWRAAAGSTAAGMEAKPYAVAAGERAIDAQLKRLGLPGHAMAVPDAPGAFQVRYELTGHPKISVLIPSKDHIDDLDRCLTSLYKNAGYDNFEVIVIENNSTDPATFAYYETLPSRFADCRVVYYKGAFNFSAINNFGATFAEGEHLLLLNNDIEVLSPRLPARAAQLQPAARRGRGGREALLPRRHDPARGRADGHQRQRGPQPQELPPHRCGGHVPLGHDAELYGRDGCLPDDKSVALPRIWRAGRGKVCRRLQRCGLLLKAVAEGAVERLHPARRGLSL